MFVKVTDSCSTALRHGLIALFVAMLATSGFASDDLMASSSSVTDTLKQNAPAKKSSATNARLTRGERKRLLRELPERWHQFLEEVDPIILPEEIDTFLKLESDAQREYFVEGFWAARDDNLRTSRNEYRENYVELLAYAKSNFRYLVSDRSKILLTHGMPADRVEIDCHQYFQPLEIWYYPYIEGLGSDVLLTFYYPRIGADFRLWTPMFGRTQSDISDLQSIDGEQNRGRGLPFALGCRDGDLIGAAIAWSVNHVDMATKIFDRPEVDVEHAARTMRKAVVPDPDAPQLDGSLEISYPGARGTRTVLDVKIEINPDQLTPRELSGTGFYNLDVTGEVLLGESFFETFRYRFDYPSAGVNGMVPIVFERALRANDYRLRLKVRDVNGGAEVVLERDLTVPTVDHPIETAEKTATREELASLQQQFFGGEATVGIVPLSGSIQTGLTQISTLVTGNEIEKVEFWLDDERIMTKHEPPFTLELDLGLVPLLHRLRAVGLDHDGKLIAGDEIVINKGIDPFRVHIATPRIARKIEGPTRTVVEIDVPRGHRVTSVDIFLNEDRVARLFNAPWIATVDVPADLEVGYLRAVATLDGDKPRIAEDLVFLNRPDFLQELDVHLVELPTTVLRGGHPVENLDQSAFTILDEGQPIEIARFERVANVPLSVGVAIDSSASMEERIFSAQEAAAGFFSTVLGAKDRAFLVGFSEVPVIMNRWTNALPELAGGLAALRAESTTALYDAVVYSLYNFQGVEGQKALIILSDGDDTSSRFTWEQTLQYSRRSGIPIYTIGLGIPISERAARGALSKLAKETGGRVWFPGDVDELAAIYATIELELRSQYLLGFYPPADLENPKEWREVEVVVEGARARTIRGYYP